VAYLLEMMLIKWCWWKVEVGLRPDNGPLVANFYNSPLLPLRIHPSSVPLHTRIRTVPATRQAGTKVLAVLPEMHKSNDAEVPVSVGDPVEITGTWSADVGHAPAQDVLVGLVPTLPDYVAEVAACWRVCHCGQ